MSDDLFKINYMDITEFRETGYLHEVNRLFLHPLGLALEIVREEDGTEHLGGIWDYRDTPEGVLYGELDQQKIENMRVIQAQRVDDRVDTVGFWIQMEDWNGA